MCVCVCERGGGCREGEGLAGRGVEELSALWRRLQQLMHPALCPLPAPAPRPLQCDRWEGSVEAGKVYLISKASLRNKRGNFNQTRHAYEIHLETHSQVEPCPDDDQDGSDIPLIFFNVRFREGGGRAL